MKQKDATVGQTQGEQKSKMKTLAKVQGRTEQLLGYMVDKVSVFAPQDQHHSFEVMEIKKNLDACVNLG